MSIEWLLAEIEKKAGRCLGGEPPADHVRDLAREVLELVQRLRAGEHPYRSPAPQGQEASSLVALERALDECKEKLARAERELEKRR
jgi:hypothetical protein